MGWFSKTPSPARQKDEPEAYATPQQSVTSPQDKRRTEISRSPEPIPKLENSPSLAQIAPEAPQPVALDAPPIVRRSRLESIRAKPPALSSPSAGDASSPVFAFAQIAESLFRAAFPYFIKAMLYDGGSPVAEDHTEFSAISERPTFKRKLRVGPIKPWDRLTGTPEDGPFRAAPGQKLVLEAWAHVGAATSRLLGHISVPLDGLSGDRASLLLPGAQFIRDGKVYGKATVSTGFERVREIEPPPVLDFGVPGIVRDEALKPIVKAASGEPSRLSEEVQNLLVREHAARCEQVRKGQEELAILGRHNERLAKENAELKARLEGETDSVVSAEELSSLSPEELAVKLRTSLSRYRAERARNEEMKKRFEEAERDAEKKAELEAQLAAIAKEHQQLIGELERAKAEEEKVETFKETIIAQEQVIARLEKVIQKSVKEVKEAQTAQLELERMRGELARLSKAGNENSRGNDDPLRFEVTRARERIASLEKQLVDAAKQHARQLIELRLGTA